MSQEETYTHIPEHELRFKMFSDLSLYEVKTPEGETMVRISGYNLNMDFNSRHLRTLEDIDAACNGIADLFRKIITQHMLESRAEK